MENWNSAMDSSKRVLQEEIDELRRTCCEEIAQTRQAKSEELSVQQRSQMMAQIRELQNKVNSMILNQGAALEGPTFPIKILRF